MSSADADLGFGWVYEPDNEPDWYDIGEDDESWQDRLAAENGIHRPSHDIGGDQRRVQLSQFFAAQEELIALLCPGIKVMSVGGDHGEFDAVAVFIKDSHQTREYSDHDRPLDADRMIERPEWQPTLAAFAALIGFEPPADPSWHLAARVG